MMTTRTYFEWDVVLQGDDGNMHTHRIRNLWDPKREGTADAIKAAAQGEMHIESKKQLRFAAISAQLVGSSLSKENTEHAATA